jgi:hypothetical protein
MTISNRHLAPEDLIDVAEGVRAEASWPHLSACDSCRQQLTELRTTRERLQDGDVPEPSPLFWSQFSRRVSEAVAAEPSSQRWFEWLRPRVVLPVAAAAVAAALLAVALKPASPVSPAPAAQAESLALSDPLAADLVDGDVDSSLDLVADLTAGVDLDAAIDAGLTSRESAEHAVTHMNADDLAALQRLLKEAMARRGA